MPTINVNDAYILDETGAEVDKVTGLFTKNENATTGEKQMARLNIAAGGSNPNLLDNAYFVGGGSQLGDGVFPINQRGLTSYSSAQVTIDRWTLFGGSVVLAADGITVTSSPDFGQVFEPSRLPAGTYTASVKTADGKIGSITFTTTGSQFFAGGAMGDTGVTLNFIDLWTPTASLFSLQCQGVKIAAAKLEKGTVSTLANDPPPDFGEELRKCKRRFQRIYAGSPYYIFATAALAEAASYAVATLDLPVEMAAKPTLAYGGSFRLWTGTGESPHGINGMTIYDSTTPATNCSRVGLIIYSSDNITADWRYDLQADNNVNSYIDLSCEL